MESEVKLSMHEIGVRETVNFLGLTFNIETLKMTWLAMGIVILVACLATRNLKVVPQGWQNFVENRRNDGRARQNACAVYRRAVHVFAGEQLNRTCAAHGLADK